MLTDKNILINMALDHCEGEGDWQLCDSSQCTVGEDDE